ncbi:MAG: OmpA family protein [Kofleriaceae bacterium]
MALAPSAAHAEARDFSVERFQLATDRLGVLGVEWAEGRGDMAFEVGMWLGYANDPLVVYREMDGERERVGSLVQNRTAASLTASLSPQRWLAIAFDVPVVISQDRDANAAVAPMLDSLSSFGLGDLRLTVKLALLTQREHGVSLAIVPSVILPTRSSGSAYLGDRGAGFAPAIALSRAWPRWRFAVEAGYHLRRESRLLDLEVDDELFARAGIGYRPTRAPFGIDLSLAGATAAASPLQHFNQDHLEALAGLNFYVSKPAMVFVAGGIGLDEGFGTPDWRALAGIRIGTTDRRRIAPATTGVIVREPDPPPADADGDGLVDSVDHCPSSPEDFDGFEDTDGCPEVDNDKDGFADAQDACPLVAGANDGCPESDRDGDGVLDRVDNCPDEKGDPANAGCIAQQLVTIAGDKLVLIESVYFALDKAAILPRSFAVLDNVVAVLQSHPALVLEVQGHTDSLGDEGYNKKLSQRRAESVMWYLVDHGIPAKQLTAMGYGEDVPVSDNGTATGRAENRRVVFAIKE